MMGSHGGSRERQLVPVHPQSGGERGRRRETDRLRQRKRAGALLTFIQSETLAVVQPTFRVSLPFSVKHLWVYPHNRAPRYVLEESKSFQVDNENYLPQSS